MAQARYTLELDTGRIEQICQELNELVEALTPARRRAAKRLARAAYRDPSELCVLKQSSERLELVPSPVLLELRKDIRALAA